MLAFLLAVIRWIVECKGDLFSTPEKAIYVIKLIEFRLIDRYYF